MDRYANTYVAECCRRCRTFSTNTIRQVKVKENHDYILLKDIHHLNLRLQIFVLDEEV